MSLHNFILKIRTCLCSIRDHISTFISTLEINVAALVQGKRFVTVLIELKRQFSLKILDYFDLLDLS